MYPYPATQSVTLISGTSGWHIDSQNPGDLTSCYVAPFATSREERDRNACLMLPSYFDPCPGPQVPLTQSMYKRRKYWTELPKLHPCCQLVLSLPLWWCFFGWWVLRSPLYLLHFPDKFIYFCLQLRAATWHSVIPLVISQAQWFLFLLTCFTAGGTAADLDLLI